MKKKTYEREGINYFWSIKNSMEILNTLKAKGFPASTISTYDFSTLYTTLPHDLIKNQLDDLLENILLNKSLARISLSPQALYGYEIIYFKQLTRTVVP